VVGIKQSASDPAERRRTGEKLGYPTEIAKDVTWGRGTKGRGDVSGVVIGRRHKEVNGEKRIKV